MAFKALKCKKFICMLLIVLTVFTAFSTVCSAATVEDAPFISYSYWDDNSNKNAVYSKPAYEVEKIIEADDLGEIELGELTDISVNGEGYVYILSNTDSAVYILDNNYKLYKKINSFSFNGNTITFSDAKGIYVKGKQIYVCDTGNERVLIMNEEGVVSKEIKCPDSPIIPKSFKFRPTHIAVDTNDYLYILCDGSYYGALLCSEKGEFLSFYGANLTETGLLAGFKKIWNKLTMTNAKRSKSASSIPFQFSDLYIDSSNFIYTTTGSGVKIGQVKKLSPGGENVFKTTSYNYADKDIKRFNTEETIITRNYNLSNIAINKEGYIFLLDTTYGHVFLYDSEGYALSVFGGGIGRGDQQGTFKQATAIDVNGNDVLVLDSIKKTLTIFKPTEHGLNLMTARKMTIKGDYANSEPIWKEVLAKDKNCRLAYVGLAKAAYANKDYKNALHYAELGDDRNVYSQAFKYIRDDFMRENFGLLALGVILIIGGIFAVYFFVIKRKGIKLSNEVATLNNVFFHPINGFTDIRYKKYGSAKLALIVLIVFYVTKTLESNFGGFLFGGGGNSSMNAIFLFLRTIGFVLLWTFANKLVTTLLGGLGKSKDIFIIICYSLIPMIIYNVLYLVLSNVLLLNEGAFLGVFSTLALVYTFILMLIGHLIIHDYSFSKTIATFILTVVAMAIVLFFGFIFIVLIQQLWVFIQTIISEISNY